MNIVFDSKSKRFIDENGFLHVESSHISKECVNPYRGFELPAWEQAGLDPQKIYFGYRKGVELQKAAVTFNGLPLLYNHHEESADKPQKEFRIGSLGTNAIFNAPYLDNALIFTDAIAISAIENGECKELSCSYRYDPVWEKGEFMGELYDFIMTNIRGNHCALVKEGRAGSDVMVADSNIHIQTKIPVNKRKTSMAKDTYLKIAKQIVSEKFVNDSASLADAEMEIEKTAKILESGAEILEKMEEKKTTVEKAKDAEEKDPVLEKAKDAEEKDADDVKTAIDACGLDSENKDVQKAFSEGRKFGSKVKNNRSDDNKVDDMEGKTFKKGLGSGVKEEENEKAEIVKTASDSALAQFQSILQAQQEVRPYVGEVIVNIASDSADNVYGAALDAIGVQKNDHPRAAWRSVFMVSMQNKNQASLAQDSAMPNMSANSPLSNIRIL